MPIFASVVSFLMNGLISFFSLMFGYREAIAWARRTFIIALGAALLAAVAGCVTGLLAALSTVLSSAPARFVQGLGMFIPSNASYVLACMGSVWLACVVYRLKLEGLRW